MLTALSEVISLLDKEISSQELSIYIAKKGFHKMFPFYPQTTITICLQNITLLTYTKFEVVFVMR